MGESEARQEAEKARFFDFGPFRLDRRERLLFNDGATVPLAPKALDLLVLLTDEPGALRSKDELMAGVWPDVVVDESNLSQNIFLLRKALNDEGGRWIATVPRRGYRFAGDVTPVSEIAPASHQQSSDEGDTSSGSPGTDRHRWVRGRRAALLLSSLPILAALIWLGWTWARVKPQAAGGSIRSIAVLPFQPIDAKQGDRILQLGMADTLINKLSQLSEVVVTPTHSVTPYLDAHVDSLAAGRELGVDAVVEGNIQRDGRRFRCTVRMLRVADASSIWADRFDEDTADLFALEDHMAERVAAALDIHLGPTQRRGLAKRYTNDREAYELYLQGRLAWERFDREGLEASVRYYDAALRRDPHYALAYAGLAKTYSVMGIYGPLTPAEANERSKQAAMRALALDPQIAQAHVALAACAIFRDWNWTVAEEEVQRALEIDPASDAHTLRGYVLEARGRPEEALYELRRARELDPLWRIPQNDVVLSLYYSRRFDQAIVEGRKLLALEPRNRLVRLVMGRALVEKGLLDEAAAMQQSNVSQFPDYSPSVGELAAIEWTRGDRPLATKRIAQLKKLGESGDPLRRVNIALATTYAEIGDIDNAFKALDASVQERYPFLFDVRIDPSFDSIRNDPRYAQLLAKLNLAGPASEH